jgi:hypothetical protein
MNGRLRPHLREHDRANDRALPVMREWKCNSRCGLLVDGRGRHPTSLLRPRRRQPKPISANEKSRPAAAYFLSGNLTGTNCDWLFTFGAPSG